MRSKGSSISGREKSFGRRWRGKRETWGGGGGRENVRKRGWKELFSFLGRGYLRFSIGLAKCGFAKKGGLGGGGDKRLSRGKSPFSFLSSPMVSACGTQGEKREEKGKGRRGGKKGQSVLCHRSRINPFSSSLTKPLR